MFSRASAVEFCGMSSAAMGGKVPSSGFASGPGMDRSISQSGPSKSAIRPSPPPPAPPVGGRVSAVNRPLDLAGVPTLVRSQSSSAAAAAGGSGGAQTKDLSDIVRGQRKASVAKPKSSSKFSSAFAKLLGEREGGGSMSDSHYLNNGYRRYYRKYRKYRK